MLIVVSRRNSPKKRRECLSGEIRTNVPLQLEICTTLQRRWVQTAISANCICHQVLPVARTRTRHRVYARTLVRLETFELNMKKTIKRTSDRIAERFSQCRPQSIRNQWTRAEKRISLISWLAVNIRTNRFCFLALGVFLFVVTTQTVTIVFTSQSANARRRVKTNLARREYFYYHVPRCR